MDFKPGDKVICVRISRDYMNPPEIGKVYICTDESASVAWFWCTKSLISRRSHVDFLTQDFMLYDSLDEFEKLIFEK